MVAPDVTPRAANAHLLPFTRERYERLRAQLEAAGYTVVTRWRPGLRRIKLGPIVLTRDAEGEAGR